eukprot:Colp12_sorted_trinity150504_noHs@11723
MFGFGGSSTAGLENNLFQIKFAAKNMERQAKKAEKESEAAKLKIKKAIQQGNQEGARIYSENVIRKRNEALNFLRMSSRLDAVASRIQTAITMKSLTKDMGGLVKGMDKALQSMDLEKVSKIMETFEKQFEDLDVHSQVMERSMGSAMAMSTPEDQVDALIQQVADEHGLEVTGQLDAAQVGTASLSVKEEEALSARLAQLRGQAS